MSVAPAAFQANPISQSGNAAQEVLTNRMRPKAVILDEISVVASAWKELRGRQTAPNFYQSYEWCSAWIRSCSAAGRPEMVRTVTVWQGDRLVLLWPLALRSLGPFRVLHSLGEPATQYSDVLVDDSPLAAAWFESAWKAIFTMDGVDALHLKHVRWDSSLERLTPKKQRWLQLLSDSSPFIVKTPESGEVIPRCQRRNRSGRSISSLKRHMKKLQSFGAVTFEDVPRCNHRAAVQQALALKSDWLDARGMASAGYLHPGNRNTILTLAEGGHFMISRMLVGDETAAIEVGVADRGHYYSMIQSYDQRFASQSPGRLLLWHLLEKSDGIEKFDFLPPNLPHKSEWTEWSTDVTDYVVPLTMRGWLIARYLVSVRGMLVTTFDRLPTPLRRRLSRLKTVFY